MNKKQPMWLYSRYMITDHILMLGILNDAFQLHSL